MGREKSSEDAILGFAPLTSQRVRLHFRNRPGRAPDARDPAIPFTALSPPIDRAKLRPLALSVEVAALAVFLSEQTFLFKTRKLGLQQVLPYLGMGTVRDYREGSVSRPDVRR